MHFFSVKVKTSLLGNSFKIVLEKYEEHDEFRFPW